MMRILHVIDNHWRYNGMVHAAVDLACAQAALGHQVGFCSGEGSFASLLAEHQVQFFDTREQRIKQAKVAAVLGMGSAVRRFKPDVVHAHMTRAAVIAFFICKPRGIPLVTCVQNSFSKYAGLMKLGERVITGCRVVADEMASRGVPRNKLRPILNGTIGSAREVESTDDKPAITFARPAVVTFGGMHWRKGIPDLIAGFQLARKVNPDMNLYIFGEGPNKEEYRQLVNAENASNITFCDPVPNPKAYLRTADVFVLASVADPAPLIICEAREAGAAIIATRVDGIPELLEEGRAGILVDAKAPEQIAEKLQFLFSDAAALATWRENSQVSIERLTVRRVAEQSVEVYREVVHG